jgi:hypothetical protein
VEKLFDTLRLSIKTGEVETLKRKKKLRNLSVSLRKFPGVNSPLVSLDNVDQNVTQHLTG